MSVNSKKNFVDFEVETPTEVDTVRHHARDKNESVQRASLTQRKTGGRNITSRGPCVRKNSPVLIYG